MGLFPGQHQSVSTAMTMIRPSLLFVNIILAIRGILCFHMKNSLFFYSCEECNCKFWIKLVTLLLQGQSFSQYYFLIYETERSFYLPVFICLSQGLPMQIRLTWNSLEIHQPLCILSVGTKGIEHHTHPCMFKFFYDA